MCLFSITQITEDLNALLSGLWQPSPTSTTKSKSKSQVSFIEANNVTPSGGQRVVKTEKITLPKTASDSLSDSDLKLLEAILTKQGAEGAEKDFEQIVQNQIRLAVREKNFFSINLKPFEFTKKFSCI